MKRGANRGAQATREEVKRTDKPVRFKIWAEIEAEYADETYRTVTGAWPAMLGIYATLEEANAALVAFDLEHDPNVQGELGEDGYPLEAIYMLDTKWLKEKA